MKTIGTDAVVLLCEIFVFLPWSCEVCGCQWNKHEFSCCLECEASAGCNILHCTEFFALLQKGLQRAVLRHLNRVVLWLHIFCYTC